MFMTAWLFLSATLWMFAKTGLSFNLTKHPKASRSTADSVCDLYNKSVLPDISHNQLLQQDVLSNMDVGDFVWIDALQVTVELSHSSQYLKLSKHTTDSEIRSYFMPIGKGFKKCTRCVEDWNEIRKKYKPLADMNGKLKILAIMIEAKEAYWMDKYPPEYNTLDTVCVGITKTSESAFEYRWDNCTNNHNYFCVNVTTASSVEKLERSLTPMTCPNDVEAGNHSDIYAAQRRADSDEEGTGLLAPVLGGVFGLVGLVLVLTAVVCFFKRRSHQQRHARMLQRYQNSRQGNTMRTVETSRDESQRAEMLQSECQQRTLADQYEDYERPIQNRPGRQEETYSQTPGKMGCAPSAPQVPRYDAMDRELKPELGLQYECFDPDQTDLKRLDSQRSSRNPYKFPKKQKPMGLEPPPIPNPKFKKSVNRAASFSVKTGSQRFDTPIHKNFSSTTVIEDSIAVRVKCQTRHAGPEIVETDGYENQMVDNPGYKKKSAVPAELEALDQYENYGDVLSWNIGKKSDSLKDNTNDDNFNSNGGDVDDLQGADQYENYVYHLEDLSKNRKINSANTKGLGNSKGSDQLNSIDELDQYENYQTPKMTRRQNAVIVDDGDQYESYDEYIRN